MPRLEDLDINQLPMVTIMIPTYNYGHYIEGALLSALSQTYPKKGIVIIDDCSTDNTQEKLGQIFAANNCQVERGEDEKYTYEITRINDTTVFSLLLKNNCGPSEARNVGIDATIGATDIYANLDADDEMHPDKISVCVSYLMQSPRIGVVYADYDIFNEETGNVLREYKEPFSYKRLMEECIVHSGALITKAALLAVKDHLGYYDREMRTCEDYDLWIRIAEQFMICHVPQALTLVRIQRDNSTFTVDKSIWERNWQRIAFKIRARHGNQ